jgi:hypothetical protein
MDNRLELRVKLPQGREVTVALIDPLPATSEDSVDFADSIGVKNILKGIRKSTRGTG